MQDLARSTCPRLGRRAVTPCRPSMPTEQESAADENIRGARGSGIPTSKTRRAPTRRALRCRRVCPSLLRAMLHRRTRAERQPCRESWVLPSGEHNARQHTALSAPRQPRPRAACSRRSIRPQESTQPQERMRSQEKPANWRIFSKLRAFRRVFSPWQPKRRSVFDIIPGRE